MAPVVDRIDPATNEVVDSVKVEIDGRRPNGFDDLVIAHGHVWLTGNGQSGVLIKLPVDDLRDVEEVAVTGYPDEPFSAAGSIWYATNSGRPKLRGPELVRLDPRTNQEIARFDLGGVNAYVSDVVELDRVVWILWGDAVAVGGKGRNTRLAVTSTLSKIDPRSNKVVQDRLLGTEIVHGAANPVAGDLITLDESLWVTRVHDRVLQEISPAAAEPSTKIPLFAFELPWEAAALEGELWVGNLNEARIARVDPTDQSVHIYETPPELSEFTAAFGSIWITVPGASPWEDEGHILRLTEP